MINWKKYRFKLDDFLPTDAEIRKYKGIKDSWESLGLPLVRQMSSELADKEFISVQPIGMPTGLLFYFDYKYK